MMKGGLLVSSMAASFVSALRADSSAVQSVSADSDRFDEAVASTVVKRNLFSKNSIATRSLNRKRMEAMIASTVLHEMLSKHNVFTVKKAVYDIDSIFKSMRAPQKFKSTGGKVKKSAHSDLFYLPEGVALMETLGFEDKGDTMVFSSKDHKKFLPKRKVLNNFIASVDEAVASRPKQRKLSRIEAESDLDIFQKAMLNHLNLEIGSEERKTFALLKQPLHLLQLDMKRMTTDEKRDFKSKVCKSLDRNQDVSHKLLMERDDECDAQDGATTKAYLHLHGFIGILRMAKEEKSFVTGYKGASERYRDALRSNLKTEFGCMQERLWALGQEWVELKAHIDYYVTMLTLTNDAWAVFKKPYDGDLSQELQNQKAQLVKDLIHPVVRGTIFTDDVLSEMLSRDNEEQQLSGHFMNIGLLDDQTLQTYNDNNNQSPPGCPQRASMRDSFGIGKFSLANLLEGRRSPRSSESGCSSPEPTDCPKE